MRIQALLVVVAAAARAAPPPRFDYVRAQQKWTPPIERLKAVNDWFHGRGPAPKFWRVRPGVPPTSMWWVPPQTLASSSRRIAGHWQKEVNASSFAYRGENYNVVVKALNEGHTRHGQDVRSRAAVLFEILYLEVLRGAPGVPELYGGWRTEHGLVWVVQHAGAIIGQGKDRAGRLSTLSDAYQQACRDRPLRIARAWFRCFQSIVEGGFVLTCVESNFGRPTPSTRHLPTQVLTDFKIDQFTFDGEDIWLVDGPSPNTGLLVDFLRDSYAADDPVLRTGHPEGLERRRESPYVDTLLRDFRPGRGGEVCERGCSSRTYWWHACDVDQHTRCAGNFTGAPELSRCISNRCGAFDGRVHVWDAAAREWLLPRIVALSASEAAAGALRAMIKRMLAPDPEKRPTFPELLEELT